MDCWRLSYLSSCGQIRAPGILGSRRTLLKRHCGLHQLRGRKIPLVTRDQEATVGAQIGPSNPMIRADCPKRNACGRPGPGRLNYFGPGREPARVYFVRTVGARGQGQWEEQDLASPKPEREAVFLN